MDEQRAIAPAVLRHALRGLLLLGGALVFWLLFSGGAAQADGVDDTGTTDGLRQAPAAVLDAADAATTPAPKPVHAAVTKLKTRIEPTLTTTTASLADSLDQAVGSAQTLVTPVIRATGLSAPVTSVVAFSGPAQDARSHAHRVHPAVATGTATAITPADGADQDGDESRSVDASFGDPGTRNHDVPEAPAVPAVPGGSPSAPSCGLAALGGAAFTPPAPSRGRSARDQAALQPGPAYPPGCSPD